MVTEIAVTPAGVANDPRPEPVRPTDEKRIIPAQGGPSVRRPLSQCAIAAPSVWRQRGSTRRIGGCLRIGAAYEA